MAEVTVRQAVEPDLPLLVELVREARNLASRQRGGALWLQEQAPQEPLDQALRAGMAPSDAVMPPPAEEIVLSGCVDGVPVGVLLVDRRAVANDRQVARVSLVFVHERARGIGVGETLLAAAAAWASSQGCVGLDGLALPGDRDTKNLYERAGMSARQIVVYRDLGP